MKVITSAMAAASNSPAANGSAWASPTWKVTCFATGLVRANAI
jgi:hypothetical protein